ncbi:MAG: protein kinase [Rhodanobacteraceae bacterium]|jgi:serine/threonine-protein kinase|nr:protein kinase [Rhodanobacteraceae bacterium]
MRTRLGHYDIVSELGRGGMGVVYKGYEAALNRYVAIKVLADALAHDEGVRERFLREARSMAALNDPHIIQIHFIGEDAGQPYFVMEFVEGESLGSMLKREQRLTVEQAAKVIHQTAQGLATAHDRGVVHRDIKPGNLMISSRGMVKIADFGIALSNQDLSKKLTSTGEFVGTPGYLSPEVCLGKPVDRRSDIFSLGIVLFEMLTGKMPFNDDSPLGLMLEVVKAEIPDVRQLNADADPQIARILAKMIAKEPADRYQSCHELAADLATHPLVAKGGPITAQARISPAAATVIGQKTPVSAQSALPATPPTPLRNLGAVANTHITVSDQPLAPPAAPAHHSVLARPTVVNTAPRRSALPWALAALVLLGVGGGAWAWREQIPALAGLFGTPTPLTDAATPANTAPLPATTVAHSNAAEVPAATTAQPADAPAVAPTATISPSGDSLSATGPASGPAASATIASAADATEATPPAAPHDDTAAGTSGGDVVTAPTAAGGTQAPPDLPPMPATPAPAPAAAATLAKAAPAAKPVAPAKPRVPTIAVMAAGDDVIAAPAEDALVDLLRSRGFRVIEGGRGGGERPNLRALAGKADAVVFVHARPVGTQELTYYGQSSTLYTVQLGLKAYKVADGSVLWSGGAQQVNFTSLNAADKAREAIAPMLDQVDGHLDEFRPRERRG